MTEKPTLTVIDQADVVDPEPELPVEQQLRMCVIANAPKDNPYNLNVTNGNGAPVLLFAVVAKIYDLLARQGLGADVRRETGSQFADYDPEEYLLVVWFEADGEFEIDDSYGQQLRPAQLWLAHKLAETRSGYLLQKDWMGDDIAKTNTGVGTRTKRIVLPGESPN